MIKNISITVLTWNDWRNTIECLESIFQSDYAYFDVILINQGSDKYHMDKIYEWAENKIKINDEEIKFNKNKNIKIFDVTKSNKKINNTFRNIYLINLKKNIGLAPGVNKGFKFAINNNYKFISRIDCDFIITKTYLTEMIKLFDDNKSIIAASPKIRHSYLRNTVWWCGFKNSWSYLKFQRTMNLKKKRTLDNENLKGIIETDVVAGCCSFYKTSIIKEVGLEDESFKFGPDDAELSHRLKKRGKLVANLNTYTFHKIARSIEVSGWFYRSYNETRGFLLLIKKTGTRADKIIGYLYHLLRIPYFFILLFLQKRSKERVLGYTKGFYDFFRYDL
jgi:GT2 family glycosyltransferase